MPEGGREAVPGAGRGLVPEAAPEAGREPAPEAERGSAPEAGLGSMPGVGHGGVPDVVRVAVEGIVALLGGERRDLVEVGLDLSGVPEFNRRAYEVARAVSPGKTVTYGDIAHRLGMPGSAQAVGQAMGHNPFPIVVPCHRVLAAGGKDGGFSAHGGVQTKRTMLVIEGAIADEPTLF
ncbi:methylated-DNA--[protein]-cysteine S-methyltransferase [Amycolatopsis sp. NBC_00345]|uniref:methylated-DNA--[protein]-cysteine S-methyltransferase n=1 Tax=Amycolatopsis sp. NBC_00345 TaxID=2975955 RepID=UPI003FA410F2